MSSETQKPPEVPLSKREVAKFSIAFKKGLSEKFKTTNLNASAIIQGDVNGTESFQLGAWDYVVNGQTLPGGMGRFIEVRRFPFPGSNSTTIVQSVEFSEPGATQFSSLPQEIKYDVMEAGKQSNPPIVNRWGLVVPVEAFIAS